MESLYCAVDKHNDWTAPPLEKMTKLCRVHDVRLGLLTNGEEWMLVNAPNGKTSGSVTWYARLWFQEPRTLQAFSSLLGIRRFFGAENETLPALLDESLDCLEEVTDTLGSQVRTAVEVLIQGLDKADQDRNRELLRDISPTELYEAGLTVMMRLVFILCAEERGLLLLGTELYDQNYAVSTLRGQLASDADKHGAEILERRYDAWARLLAVFRAVYGGVEHADLRLPALGGSLFDPDKYPFLEGRAKGTCWKDCNPTPLPIDNRTVLLLLNSLQVLEQTGGAILLSYRALDVEQIGHIYEGLLEHTAVRAPEITLGLLGSANAKNPNISLPELESLALDSERKLFARVKEVTGRAPTAIKNAYNRDVDPEFLDKLSAVCGADQELLERITPYANWLRLDAWEQPLVYQKGSFMVTMGQDRRESGTHYTPKLLTEKIVKTTLEPVVYIGPAEGKERKDWQLKSPATLLNLKICDPAMGSGAFLVQVCRYLADRLYEAWNLAEKEGKHIDINGTVWDDLPKETMPVQVDERINIARRLIAEKCLYGVDINPLAVELAKLSIWLVTISKGRPFGFLDHNLKSGDSLLGIHDIRQLQELKMKPDGEANDNLFGQGITSTIDATMKLRDVIRSVPIRDIYDVQKMEQLNKRAQDSLARVKLIADLFIGEAFSFTGPTNRLQGVLDLLSTDADAIMDGDEKILQRYRVAAQAKLDEDLPVGKPHRRPFHWALEFPEVFSLGGFDAICGNPPFISGKRLSSVLGVFYQNYLKRTNEQSTGAADICVFFLRRYFCLIKKLRELGIIATNSIAEGDSRVVGFSWLQKQGATIYWGETDLAWEGSANVIVSIFGVFKGKWNGQILLNKKSVDVIETNLTSEHCNIDEDPSALRANSGMCSDGIKIQGDGFIITPNVRDTLIQQDPKNNDVIATYITGRLIAQEVSCYNHAYIIAFGQREYEEASKYSAPFKIVQENVKPYRDSLSGQIHESSFWKFWDKRERFFEKVKSYKRILVCPSTSKYLLMTFIRKDCVPSHSVKLFAYETYSSFAVFQSIFHEVWSRKQSGRLGQGLAYNLSRAFATFPFPTFVGSRSTIEDLGETYYKTRDQIVENRSICLTDVYNAFHNPQDLSEDLERLRQLQMSMDEAVQELYGWTDIDLAYGFHKVSYLPDNDNIRYTISESSRIEILRRLSVLNKQRWQEEQEKS